MVPGPALPAVPDCASLNVSLKLSLFQATTKTAAAQVDFILEQRRKVVQGFVRGMRLGLALKVRPGPSARCAVVVAAMKRTLALQRSFPGGTSLCSLDESSLPL